MSPSTGRRLQEARLTRGLSLEDVQHQTRIRLTQLAGMENDDMTVFDSLSYARGFYALYGRFLGVDLTGFIEGIERDALKPVKRLQYLRPSTDRVMRGRRGRPKHPQTLPHLGRRALIGTALAALVAAAAWFGHAQWRRHALAQGTPAAPADPAAVSGPFLAGTGAAVPDSSTAPDTGGPGLAGSPASDPVPAGDVRSTPPPVLKALPVDETGKRSIPPGSTGPGDAQSSPEVRRPAPLTR